MANHQHVTLNDGTLPRPSFVFCRDYSSVGFYAFSAWCKSQESRLRIQSPGKSSANPVFGTPRPDQLVQRGEHEPLKACGSKPARPAGPSRAAVGCTASITRNSFELAIASPAGSNRMSSRAEVNDTLAGKRPALPVSDRRILQSAEHATPQRPRPLSAEEALRFEAEPPAEGNSRVLGPGWRSSVLL